MNDFQINDTFIITHSYTNIGNRQYLTNMDKYLTIYSINNYWINKYKTVTNQGNIVYLNHADLLSFEKIN